MKIMLAPCTFKGSLSAREAAQAMARALVSTDISVEIQPVSDGGEGLVDCFLALEGWQRCQCRVQGPMPGMSVEAVYARSLSGHQAVIEMAAAAGLPMVPPDQRNPLLATTRGFGELMLDALESGARRLILGLGGSATVDGGAGMAAALGLGLFDKNGQQIPDGGGGLSSLERIDASALSPQLQQAVIEVACDVDSPLLGPDGAAAVFGPQKGATPEIVAELEAGLTRLADCCRDCLGRDVRELVGAGAAGGLGAGLNAFCGAQLLPGADLLMDAVGFSDRLAGVDLLITGEGSMDRQSLRGKAPAVAARRAAEAGVPVLVIAGSLQLEAEQLSSAGISAAWQLTDLAPVEECINRAGQLIEQLLKSRLAEIKELASR
jgi:glycerate 2-kinase